MKVNNEKNEKIYSSLNKSLHLVILPTEQCNFRCFYCYEDYQNGKMSLETINGLKKFLENRAQDLDLLILEWFGGEIESFINILDSKVSSEHILSKNDSIKEYCFASYPNSLVIRSTGEICKCSLVFP